jgi:hypothetical protein
MRAVAIDCRTMVTRARMANHDFTIIPTLDYSELLISDCNNF